jgi:glutamate synthase (NADPH) large chain
LEGPGLDFSNILYQPEVRPMWAATARSRRITAWKDRWTTRCCSRSVNRPAGTGRKGAGRTAHPQREPRGRHHVGSELTRRYGAEGLPEDTILIHFKGIAGQSFGAFMPRGMTFPRRRRQ